MSRSPRPLIVDPTRSRAPPHSPPPAYVFGNSRAPDRLPGRIQSVLLPASPRDITGVAVPPVHSPFPSFEHRQQDSSPRRSEPGYFDSNLGHTHQQNLSASNENFSGLHGGPNPQRHYFEIPQPRRLHDPLDRIGGRHIDTPDNRTSQASDVSSLTPSEAQMLSGDPMIDPVMARNLGSHNPELMGVPMDILQSLPEGERFSNVPTIFDVAVRDSTKSVKAQPSSELAQVRRDSKTTTESGAFFDVTGSHSASTRPEPASSSQTTELRLLGPAPIFSLTAGAATGDVVIRNHTPAESSVGSEDVVSTTRHYDGCMLCSPLPSPTSSIYSFMPDGPMFAPSDQHTSGPPPDTPLPQLLPQVMESSPIKKMHLELEGEVTPYNPSRDGFVPVTPSVLVPPPSLLGDPGPDYFSPHPQAEIFPNRPLYAHPGHGGSLSTLIEGDEESHHTHSRQPSRLAMSRSSQEAARQLRGRSGEHSRPQTGTHSVELSRTPTAQGNHSQNSLLHGDIGSPMTSPLANRDTFQIKSRNPFKRGVSPLSAIQEAGNSSKRSSWRGVFGKDDTQPPAAIPGTDANDIELNSASNFRGQPNPRADPATPDPHPGQRRDRPGVDGAYEVVDLVGPPGNISSDPYPGLRRQKSGGVLWLDGALGRVRKIRPPSVPGGWIKWLLITLAIVAAIMMIILPILFVAFPAMAQKAVDNARLEISSLSISGAEPDSLNLMMEVKLNSQSSMSAFVGPNALRLIMSETNSSFKQKSTSNYRTRRNHIPGHYSVEPGIFGYLRLVQESKREIDAAEGVKLAGDKDGRFFISDVDTWGKVLEKLIFEKDGVGIELQGDIEIKSGGLKAECQLSKSIILPGIGGFDVDVSRYNILEEEEQTFTAQFDLQSNSSTQLDLGKVNFQLLFGSVPIGEASVDSFKVSGGRNNMAANGSLDKNVMRNDSELLGRFLTALFIPTNNNPTATLSLRGVNATSKDLEIEWLRPAVGKLQVPLPAANDGPEKNILESFEMALSLVLNQTKPTITSGYISSNLNLPFASKGFSALVKKVEHNLELSTPAGTKFARLTSPMSPSSGQNGKVVVAFNKAELNVTDRKAWADGFLKPLLQTNNFTVFAGGNLTAEVETSLGNASIRDIGIQTTNWRIKGYGNLTDGGKTPVQLDSPELTQSSPDGLHINVNVKFEGSGDLRLGLGNVVFRAFYDTMPSPIGNLSIPFLTLSNGSNTYDAVLTIGTTKSEQDSASSFLTAFFAGGRIPLLLTAPSGSTIPEVAAALRGIVVTATINSPGYLSLLRKAGLLLYTNTESGDNIRGIVELSNPFLVPIAITRFNLSMFLPEPRVKLGSIDPLVLEEYWLKPGQSVTFEVDLTDGIGIPGTQECFKGGIQRNVAVEGTVAIEFGKAGFEVGIEAQRRVKLVTIAVE